MIQQIHYKVLLSAWNRNVIIRKATIALSLFMFNISYIPAFCFWFLTASPSLFFPHPLSLLYFLTLIYVRHQMPVQYPMFSGLASLLPSSFRLLWKLRASAWTLLVLVNKGLWSNLWACALGKTHSPLIKHTCREGTGVTGRGVGDSAEWWAKFLCSHCL